MRVRQRTTAHPARTAAIRRGKSIIARDVVMAAKADIIITIIGTADTITIVMTTTRAMVTRIVDTIIIVMRRDIPE